jgi:hypothetical protein
MAGDLLSTMILPSYDFILTELRQTEFQKKLVLVSMKSARNYLLPKSMAASLLSNKCIEKIIVFMWQKNSQVI